MIQENYCPKTEKCPLFNGEMLASKKAQEIFMNLYCTAGVIGRMECKRFLVAERGYTPPPDLMPNDTRSTDDIIKLLT